MSDVEQVVYREYPRVEKGEEPKGHAGHSVFEMGPSKGIVQERLCQDCGVRFITLEAKMESISFNVTLGGDVKVDGAG